MLENSSDISLGMHKCPRFLRTTQNLHSLALRKDMGKSASLFSCPQRPHVLKLLLVLRLSNSVSMRVVMPFPWFGEASAGDVPASEKGFLSSRKSILLVLINELMGVWLVQHCSRLLAIFLFFCLLPWSVEEELFCAIFPCKFAHLFLPPSRTKTRRCCTPDRASAKEHAGLVEKSRARQSDVMKTV